MNPGTNSVPILRDAGMVLGVVSNFEEWLE